MTAFAIALGMALLVGQLLLWRQLARIHAAGRVLPRLGSVPPTLKQLQAAQDYDHAELGQAVTGLDTTVKEALAEVRMASNSLRHLADFIVQQSYVPFTESEPPDG